MMQMAVDEEKIYMLTDDMLYQYDLEDMNLNLRAKVELDKLWKENYFAGIFTF